MRKKTTGELMEALQASKNIDQYIAENGQYLIRESLADSLNRLIEEKRLAKSAVIKKAEMNEIYGYQIFSGTRTPSRDKLLSLCIGMALSLEETQQMLKLAGFAPLYPKSKRDSIFILGIEKQAGVCAINETLYNSGEATVK